MMPRRVHEPRHLDLTSSMRIGSLTKTPTATAILQLVDQHLVDLAEPIESYLPCVVPNSGAITVRQLLNMRGALQQSRGPRPA